MCGSDWCCEGKSEYTVKQRCIVEEIETTVSADNGATEKQRVGYEYGTNEDGKEIVSQVRLLTTDWSYRPDDGRNYTKEQLKAHIKNLETILSKFN